GQDGRARAQVRSDRPRSAVVLADQGARVLGAEGLPRAGAGVARRGGAGRAVRVRVEHHEALRRGAGSRDRRGRRSRGPHRAHRRAARAAGRFSGAGRLSGGALPQVLSLRRGLMTWTVKEYAPSLWPALEELFGENGACGGCWCMVWRVQKGERWDEL